MHVLQRRLLPSMSALSALDAVARSGSFTAAARELSLTQGAISRQILALEAQLGVQLVERKPGGVALTATGETYAKTTAQALALLRDASLGLMTNMQDHQLNLAILPTFGTRWLLPRIPDFVAAHPQITLNFVTRIGKFDLADAGIDAAIHIGQPDWPGMQPTFLMDEMVAPVCSPGFLKLNPLKAPQDLLKLPLIHMASRPGAWEHWFASLNMQAPPRSHMRFEQFLSVAEACRAGLGVALMPLFLIRAELASGALVKAFDHQVKSPAAYYLMIPQNRAHHRPTLAFRDWMLQEIRQSSQIGESQA